MSDEETQRVLTRCLNGMLRFWIQPYVNNGNRIKEISWATYIPGPILLEFAKGNLDLAPEQAEALHEYFKSQDAVVPLPHHDGYDFDALVEDVRSYVDVDSLWHRYITAYMVHHVGEISRATDIPKVTLKRYADGTLLELGARASLDLRKYLDRIQKEEITDEMKRFKKNERYREKDNDIDNLNDEGENENEELNE